MKIKKIKIKNFRQYMDIELSFPSNSTYDLNYILAENGIGKTTLLNSITWCLYGEEKHVTDGLKNKTLPLITLKSLREMQIGEEKDTSVSITIEDLSGEITFVRWRTYRKAEDGTAYEKGKFQKVISTPKNGEPDVFNDEESFKEEVNKRLPSKIQQFFFFDGEQLDTYLASTAGLNVEQTVLQISQIDLLVTMEKNLATISDEMRRKAARTSTKSSEINDEYEKKKKETEELKAKYKKDDEYLKKAKNDLESIKNELGDDPDVSELEMKRDELENKLKALEIKKNKNLDSIRYFLKQYLTLLSALPRMKEMYDLILEKEKNKQLPPKYDREELQQMLKQQHCHVCNRQLDADANIFISNLIKRYEIGQETGTILTSIFGILQIRIKEASKYEVERNALFNEKDQIKNDIDEKSKEFNELNSLINKYTNKEHIIILYEERSKLEKYIETMEKNVFLEEKDLENMNKDLDELLKKLNEALSKDKKNVELRKQAKLAEKSKNKVSEIIADIKGGIRKQISDEMSSKFFELMWKRKFSKVEITNNYSASVINNDGFECLGSCSAAERELLVLAFTLALHQESGFDGPLVIDTPISRISGILREAFANVLCSVSKNKQIILFVTEDEYSENVKKIFECCANRKYKFELVNEDFVKVGNV